MKVSNMERGMSVVVPGLLIALIIILAVCMTIAYLEIMLLTVAAFAAFFGVCWLVGWLLNGGRNEKN